MPSLFTNDQSKGPLYQYWKERSAEEKSLRDRRTQEAKIRGNGFIPLDPAYGPSSNDSYAHRAMSGPPGYRNASDVPTEGGHANELPAYVDTTSSVLPAGEGGADPGDKRHLSAEEEKARLQRLEQQRQQDESDAAFAQTLANGESQGDNPGGKGKEPERKKSVVGKVGSWLGDAATGFTKNQERW